MIKVLFLGSRPLGVVAIEALSCISGVKVVGAITKKPPSSAWWTDDPYNFSLPPVDHKAIIDLDFDFGVSINYWKMIEPEVIAKPRLGFINLHHSYNLSLRGRDMTTHAILSARETGRWYHGSTLHYTDDGLDTGPIIASDSCPISEEDTAWSLFQRTEEVGGSLLRTWLPRLIEGRPPVASPENNQPLNMRKHGEDVRVIENIFEDPLRTYDIVRAYDFNGHYAPASSVVDGKSIGLSTHAENGRLLIDLGGGRKVFGLNSS